MLFKFKSQATSDLIMLEPDARALLKMMLGDDPVKGIVLAHDLPSAIAQLESALAQEAANSPSQTVAGLARTAVDDEEALDTPVHLGQRAAPMLHMLKRCLAEKSDLVWGV
jgi:hypothetical protein